MVRRPGSRHRGPGRCRGNRAQSTVELALALPVVFLLLLVIVQVAVVVRGHLLVLNAAREGARSGAVERSLDAARGAAAGSGTLDPRRLEVVLTGGRQPGQTITAEVSYRVPTDVPLVGRLIGDVTVRAKASMRVE